MENYTDNSEMTFGKYKGEKLINVPAKRNHYQCSSRVGKKT